MWHLRSKCHAADAGLEVALHRPESGQITHTKVYRISIGVISSNVNALYLRTKPMNNGSINVCQFKFCCSIMNHKVLLSK